MAHTFGQTAGEIKPTKPTLPEAGQNRLPHRATPKFWLRAHPYRWQLVGDEWLPLFGSMKSDLGVNGCDKLGNMDVTHMESARRGWVTIPWDVFGEEYVDVYPAQGGDYHCTVWEKPRHLGDKVLKPKIDTKGLHDFARRLIKEGVIPGPDPDILEQVHLDQQQKEVDRLAKESHKPGVEPVYQAATKKLEAMKKAIAKLRKAA